MADKKLSEAVFQAAKLTDRFPVEDGSGESFAATTVESILSLGSGNSSVTSPIFRNYSHPRQYWKDRDNVFRVLFIGNSNVHSAIDNQDTLLRNLGLERSQYSIYFIMKGGGTTQDFVDDYNNNVDQLLWSMPAGGNTVTGDLTNNSNRSFEEILNNPWDLIVFQVSRTEIEVYAEFEEPTKELVKIIKQHCPTANLPIGIVQSFTSGGVGDSTLGWQAGVANMKRQYNEIGVDFIIPLGTMIQNARATTGLQTDDDLLSDGIHLYTGIGQYMQNVCMFKSVFEPVFGIKVENNNISIAGEIPTTSANIGLANTCNLNAHTNMWVVEAASGSIEPAQRYSITYNANGGSGTITDSNTYLSGSTVAIRENSFTRTDYRFLYYNTQANGSGTTYTAGQTTTITSNLTLYAIWEEITGFSVTYNANGGSGSVLDTTQYVNGATVTVMASTFAREGFTFTGYNTLADGSGTTYEVGDTFVINADTTLYAIWQEAQVIENAFPVVFNGTRIPIGTIVTYADFLLADGSIATGDWTEDIKLWRWKTEAAPNTINNFISGATTIVEITIGDIPGSLTSFSGVLKNAIALERFTILDWEQRDGSLTTGIASLCELSVNVKHVTMPPYPSSFSTTNAFVGNTGFTSVGEGIVNADGTISSSSDGVFPTQLYRDDMGFVNI